MIYYTYDEDDSAELVITGHEGETLHIWATGVAGHVSGGGSPDIYLKHNGSEIAGTRKEASATLDPFAGVAPAFETPFAMLGEVEASATSTITIHDSGFNTRTELRVMVEEVGGGSGGGTEVEFPEVFEVVNPTFNIALGFVFFAVAFLGTIWIFRKK